MTRSKWLLLAGIVLATMLALRGMGFRLVRRTRVDRESALHTD